MSAITDRLQTFLKYVQSLNGDEKGEAQVYCDRLFQAFGHKGYKEAGAELEYRVKIKSTKGTSFADLVWKPRMLLEMKRRGEKLYEHYQQAFNYWLYAVPNRPRYVVLCNFDEFWIYDFDKQMNEPVDIVAIGDLPHRYSALNFLFPHDPDPVFGNDLEAVSRDAADKVAQLFNRLANRGVSRTDARRFVLQLVIAMFSEDIDLMPKNVVCELVNDCLKKGQSAYDLFGALFNQMNTNTPAGGGRFQGVPYFNGGVFQAINPIDLDAVELDLIGGDDGAATKDWSKVNPAIFGTIFQQSMDIADRHAFGAHFTSEADILRIINPTIVEPLRQKLHTTPTMTGLLSLREDLRNFKVLDPACGSGNFLYLAYRELARVEIALLAKLKQTISDTNFQRYVKSISLVSPRQFFGIDRDIFGVELAKITLMLAKKLALDEAVDALKHEQFELPLQSDDALPLDNLDANVACKDALFIEWPEVNVIIGNPPYQSKNKMQQELGLAYVNKVRSAFPEIDGRADYCVYWFRKAHDHLKPGHRAGLVGTNTIRQNYSRTGGLDYIVNNGGTITEAVSSMKWSGDAVVFVSIVNWIKGLDTRQKRLYVQEGNDPDEGWRHADVEFIGPALSFAIDVTRAQTIKVNAAAGGCYQGQTHGHRGFLLREAEAEYEVARDSRNMEVIFPYLIANDLVGNKESLPTRHVIDFSSRPLLEAQSYHDLFSRIKGLVLPDRERAAESEQARNDAAMAANPNARTNRHHKNFLNYWWQLSYQRREMLNAISSLDRYIVCGRVTARPIFEFISRDVRPNDALMVFPYDDDYSFGILQSSFHWTWFTNRCSTLKGDPRYTSNTVFDSFPWPQSPTWTTIRKVAAAASELRALRRQFKKQYDMSFRELYRSIEFPGASPLKDAHQKLDTAVRTIYGIGGSQDQLSFLLDLNQKVANNEAAGKTVLGPGIPATIKSKAELVTRDCVRIPAVDV